MLDHRSISAFMHSNILEGTVILYLEGKDTYANAENMLFSALSNMKKPPARLLGTTLSAGKFYVSQVTASQNKEN